MPTAKKQPDLSEPAIDRDLETPTLREQAVAIDPPPAGAMGIEEELPLRREPRRVDAQEPDRGDREDDERRGQPERVSLEIRAPAPRRDEREHRAPEGIGHRQRGAVDQEARGENEEAHGDNCIHKYSYGNDYTCKHIDSYAYAN